MFWAHFNFRSFFALQSTLYFKLDGHFVNATVLLSDLLAGNGMIHVIDKIMWHVEDYRETSSVSCLVPNFLQTVFDFFALAFYKDLLKKDILGSGFLYTRFMEITDFFKQLIWASSGNVALKFGGDRLDKKSFCWKVVCLKCACLS